jgi:hypothetical protein
MSLVFPTRALTLSLSCLLLALQPACKNTGFKLPKLNFKKGADSTGAETAASTTPATPGPVDRSPEEVAFLAKCKELGASGAIIAGEDGYHFSGTELQRLALLQDPNSASIRAASSALLDYRDQLKRKGIELIFVPVPPKAVIFPDKLAKDLKIKVRGKKPARLDSALEATYDALRSKGLNVIDPTDALLANRENKKLGPIFPKSAPVWAPRGAETTASLIGGSLKGAKWANQPGKEEALITEAASLTYSGPLFSTTAVTETLAARNIGRTADGKMRSVTFSTGGHPLALIGDNTLLAWREANNPAGSNGAFASLADQLAFELQTTPDLFPGKADGRNAPRSRILRDISNGKNPLSNTKTLVWVIQATDLALSDWRRIPLRLEVKASAPGTPMFIAPPVSLIPDAGSRTTPPPAAPEPAPAPSNSDPAAPELPR